MAALEPGDDLLYPVQVDDGRAMRAKKRRRVQARLQFGQRAAQLAPHVGDHSTNIRPNPSHTLIIVKSSQSGFSVQFPLRYTLLATPTTLNDSHHVFLGGFLLRLIIIPPDYGS